MYSSTKQCNLSHKMIIRLKKFLYIFNLRQGTILIAVHQIALSSFALIILLVGIFHLDEMLSMLQNDMADDADRQGLYLEYGHVIELQEGDFYSANFNRRRFAKGQHLASVTVIFLYTSTILTSIYLLCCVSLLHGAVKYKREYVTLWIMAAIVALSLLLMAIFIGDGYPWVVKFFGGHCIYRFGCALFVLSFIYAICAVSSFVMEIGCRRCRSARTASDERGERLLLLDQAAHSSLLSSAQLHKLSHGTRSQFV
ncbi:uncharacterized protein LOC128673351 [Plodia interpunctella]|uniref:uncharacterized protein LOC128673351 n=1 Tax=Plodia interpunctella TaxID=58824 RepID=UPI0023680F07|nr:uncharacterized protein LOC128673351 [Plodia interpunctella]